MSQRVVILGGGIAGLSAAHELVERGFLVEVFDRHDRPGGKARSLPAGSSVQGGASPLPGEHGFRFFPGFYRHVVDTMSRIPYGTRTTADNLVETTAVQIALYDRPSVFVPARFPLAPEELRTSILFVLSVLAGRLGVDPIETAFMASKVWQVLSSCDERRMTEYERTSWWDFIEAPQRSAAYQQLFGHGITRSLVAAKARRASAKTIGNIFVQILLDMVRPGRAADRLLNGPTNDVWLDPWLAYLRARGVVYHLEADVQELHLRGGSISGATVTHKGRPLTVHGDYYLAALPVERMAELVNPELAAADRALAALADLSHSVEWMNGIQFFLTEDAPLVHGHTIYLSSPWALTSISQQQFWREIDLRTYGDGRVRGILSVDISNWQTPGLDGKTAEECTPEEIRREVWSQIKRSVNSGGQVVLRDDMLHSSFLDPDIVDDHPSRPGRKINLEPLLVNYVDTWRIRPEVATRIPNLFLASDYVRTHSDLATMESANEAARRATNAILMASGSDSLRCTVWPLREPDYLLPFKAYDRQRFRMGLPWDEPATGATRRMLSAASRVPEDGQGVASGEAYD